MKSLSELGGTILHNPTTHISTEENHSVLQLEPIMERLKLTIAIVTYPTYGRNLYISLRRPYK